MTGNARYSFNNIQTVNGTTQPVVGMGMVNCTNFVKMSSVLHASSFPINLLSVSAIILQLKYVVSFDIPKVIIQERGDVGDLGLAHGILDYGIWIVKAWVQH